MSREKKFRVFCETHKRWEFYTIGDLICGGALESAGEGLFDGESWQDFTGLKDRKGVEVYEGDECEGHSDGNGKIVWNKEFVGWDYEFEDGNIVGIWEVSKDLIVVGNSHKPVK